MSLVIISHLTETLSALVASLKEKEAENAKLKEELEKQKIETDIENSDSKFFQGHLRDEQEWRVEFQNKLKKQKDKLEKTREALRKAEVEKTILTSATPVAPKTHDVYIYVYRDGTIGTAESEKAAMAFFDDDFENYVAENELTESKEKQDRVRTVKHLAISGCSNLNGEGIVLKKVSVPSVCKEEVDSELEDARKIGKNEGGENAEEEIKVIKGRRSPHWIKEGVTVRYLERNRIITNIVRNRIELDSRIWVNSTEIEKA